MSVFGVPFVLYEMPFELRPSGSAMQANNVSPQFPISIIPKTRYDHDNIDSTGYDTSRAYKSILNSNFT